MAALAVIPKKPCRKAGGSRADEKAVALLGAQISQISPRVQVNIFILTSNVNTTGRWNKSVFDQKVVVLCSKTHIFVQKHRFFPRKNMFLIKTYLFYAVKQMFRMPTFSKTAGCQMPYKILCKMLRQTRFQASGRPVTVFEVSGESFIHKN